MSTTETRTHTTITIPKAKSEFGLKVPSIRQIMLAGIFFGSSNLEIGQLIHRYHEGSAPTTNAKKMSKHIGWYRSRCNDPRTPEYRTIQQMIAQVEAPQHAQAVALVA